MATTSLLKKYQYPLILTGVALAGYLGYKWYRKRNPTDESSMSADEKAAKAKGQALSYTLTSYQGLANTIYNAWFQRFNPFNAVDETIVLSVMDKMKNDLFELVVTRDNVGESMWYMYTGLLLTSIVQLKITNRGCASNPKTMEANYQKFLDQEQKAKEKKEKAAATYTISG